MTQLRPPHDPAASCDGKVAFDSHRLANDVIKRRARTKRTRQPYHCGNCGKWHLGRAPAHKARLAAAYREAKRGGN